MEACRACLSTETDMIPLDETFVNAYNVLTNLNISVLDAMPQYVCRGCVEAVKFCMDFREKCITTETSLQQILLDKLKSEESKTQIENQNDLDVLHIKEEVKVEENDDSVFDDCLNVLGQFDEDDYFVKNEETEDIIPKKRKYKKRKCTDSTKEVKMKLRKKTASTKEKKIQPKIEALGTDVSCGLCKKTFIELEDLSNHVESHKKDRTCIQCSEIFTDWPNLLGHRFKHIPKKEYKCHICRKSCHSCVHMEYHYMKEHFDGTKTKLTCQHCFRLYDTPRQLSKHINHVHSNKCFICDYCSKIFNNKQLLTIHMRSHSNKKAYVCDLCGFSCKHSGGLKDHKIRKHAPGKVRCDNCLRVFANAEDRDKHTCNKDPKICPFCGKQVNQRFSRHLQVHSAVGRYKCPRCPAIYRTHQALKAHINKHDGIRTNQCEYCPLKFYTRSVLIKHRRVHTGEKPYVCKICQKGFTGNHNLKVHMKVHGVDLVTKRTRPEYQPPTLVPPNSRSGPERLRRGRPSRSLISIVLDEQE